MTRATTSGFLKRSFIERNSAISRRSFRSPSCANERGLFHHNIGTKKPRSYFYRVSPTAAQASVESKPPIAANSPRSWMGG